MVTVIYCTLDTVNTAVHKVEQPSVPMALVLLDLEEQIDRVEIS